MGAFKFVHAADLRLDGPFTGLHRPSAAVLERLRDVAYQALDNLVALCKAERADFLLVAGDVFDGADRSVRAQFRFRDALADLAAGGTESFVVHGCCDPLPAWLSSIDWPEGVHVFGPHPGWAEYVRDDEVLAVIRGASVLNPGAPGAQDGSPPPPPPPGPFTIDLRHCDTDSMPLGEADYRALGATPGGPGAAGTPDLAGSPVGPVQGTCPEETGPHGCRVIEVEADRSVTARFAALDAVRREDVAVDISGVREGAGAVDAITGELARVAGRAGGRDVLCTVALTGARPAAAPALGDQRERLLDEVRLAVGMGRPWVWVDRIVDRTVVQGSDLDGVEELPWLVNARLNAALATEEDIVTFVSGVAAELAGPRYRDLSGHVSPDEWRAWLQEAGRLAIQCASPALPGQ